MKKICGALPLAVIALCRMCGCVRKNSVAQKTDGKITVTATIFPPYDFVRAIAKDRVYFSIGRHENES